MGNERQALRWIVDLLQRLEVPFQAVGGLAARAYGAHRPLADLDFYIPTGRLADVAVAGKAQLVRAPARHRDDSWDLIFMALQYDGCKIELGGADDARFYDRRKKCWRDADVDFARSSEQTIFDVAVPTMPRDELVRYKSGLDRDVDREDIEQMSR